MSLADAAREQPQPAASCWASLLPPELRDQLDEVEAMQAAGLRINRAAVWRELRKHGVEIEAGAVLRHFRFECRCRKPDSVDVTS